MEIPTDQLAVKRGTAARLLDCGTTTIWKLEKAGEIRAVKVGADTRITVESLRAFIQRQTAKAAEAA